jgi:hypothetical protein
MRASEVAVSVIVIVAITLTVAEWRGCAGLPYENALGMGD